MYIHAYNRCVKFDVIYILFSPTFVYQMLCYSQTDVNYYKLYLGFNFHLKLNDLRFIRGLDGNFKPLKLLLVNSTKSDFSDILATKYIGFNIGIYFLATMYSSFLYIFRKLQ